MIFLGNLGQNEEKLDFENNLKKIIFLKDFFTEFWFSDI